MSHPKMQNAAALQLDALEAKEVKMEDTSDKMTPSAKGSDDRDSQGRFVKGWRGGPGNPLARQTEQLRHELVNAVTRQDIKAIVEKLIAKAKGGDTGAAIAVLDRIFGRPTQSIAVSSEGGNSPHVQVNLQAIPADPDLLEQVNAIALRMASAGVRPGKLIESQTKQVGTEPTSK